MGPLESLDPAPEGARATARRRTVLAWGLWDWGSAAFNAVITTFVFTVYLTADGDDGPLFGSGVDTKLGWALAAAGLTIAVLAPVTGQRADSSGRRTFWLGAHTGVVVLASALMFFVEPDPGLLWLGLLLLAVGNVFFELASVNYNAMLGDISTPATVGRISGLGWGLGYLGGIVLLLIVYFGFISPDVGLFGVTGDNGLDVRVTMLVCAVWTLLFSLPVLLSIRDRPRPEAAARGPRQGVLAAYRHLFATVAGLWRTDRNTVYFLGASAVFRDGLAGVFTFGAVLAAGSFGFSSGGVIIFGIAANVVAGIATIGFGLLDDKIGPKRVIVGSLAAMCVAGSVLFVLHDGGSGVFWVFGLILCIFVGPAQSASRSLLSRLIRPGMEGQVFGLYATTGRAASFLAPAAWALALTIASGVTGSPTEDVQYAGIIGILVVLLAGLLLLLPVRAPRPGEQRAFQESSAAQ
ncbi:MFS transporter [Nocardioides zeae]|uniref:MFS transporter n=1 Tax=Nocardioides imazamoxiresistens TaxID=3231893 RepID=A0ABU3PSX8_9ACTN|nr:MFS transporter [Nocardioides zeae]MDT9592336.1 MFS transporter [Nocardioides zeae]